MKEHIILILDTLIGLGFAAFAIYCFVYIWRGIKHKCVAINGQVATREAEPVGYWLVIASLGVVASLCVYGFFNGL